MKFPLSLLKRFLITEATLEEISATLTRIGLEVESIEDKASALKPFEVAEILEAEPHPQADKLRVCKVNTAAGVQQIVCGASNARAGIKVVLAPIGSVIPTNGLTIKKSAIRGVESNGMLCSAAELGLGIDGNGIIELAADAPVGQSIVELMKLNDPVIDIAITANRADCMGVYGVARDLAAAGLGKLKPLCVPEIKTDAPCAITIQIEDTDGCPAFLGRTIRGVKNGASPQWLQDALTKAGMRPISALVDITNYFTLAFGRPLHVYDLAKVSGSITARRALEGETLEALNEKTYTLAPRDCVIADNARVLGLGGIMGGSHSGVTESTTDILLEVALFNPLRIAQSGRALQIDSDARTRFERGVDPAFVEIAAAHATDLILELCGGTASETTLAGAIPTLQKKINFSADAVNILGGTNIHAPRMKEILESLGFVFHGSEVTVPSWRHDVSQQADLAEEVLRIEGLDAIPATPLPKPTHIVRSTLTPAQARLATIRRTIASRGYKETYGWGFCSQVQAKQFGGQPEALELLNPISSELSVMRPNLLPHLLTAVAANAARGEKDLALFEQGAVFAGLKPEDQKTIAAGVRSGLRAGGLSWQGAATVDCFDAKADIAAIISLAGLDIAKVQITRTAPKWYHPGRSGAVMLGKTAIAYFGELHPSLLAQYDIDFPIIAFEVMLDALPAPKPAKRKALERSDYQPVLRDFAFVLDKTTSAGDLIAAIHKAEKNLLQNVALFDVYEGKGVPEGKKSLALTVTLQAPDRTLTDAEIETVSKAMIASAAKVGAVLR